MLLSSSETTFVSDDAVLIFETRCLTADEIRFNRSITNPSPHSPASSCFIWRCCQEYMSCLTTLCIRRSCNLRPFSTRGHVGKSTQALTVSVRSPSLRVRILGAKGGLPPLRRLTPLLTTDLCKNKLSCFGASGLFFTMARSFKRETAAFIFTATLSESLDWPVSSIIEVSDMLPSGRPRAPAKPTMRCDVLQDNKFPASSKLQRQHLFSETPG
jgi:hypothetical protein